MAFLKKSTLFTDQKCASKKRAKNSGMGRPPPIIRAMPERKRFFQLMSSLTSTYIYCIFIESPFRKFFLVWIPWLVTVRIGYHIWKQKRKEKQSGYLGQLTGLENLWPGIEQECQRWYRDTKILSAKKVSKIGLGNNSKVDFQVR